MKTRKKKINAAFKNKKNMNWAGFTCTSSAALILETIYGDVSFRNCFVGYSLDCATCEEDDTLELLVVKEVIEAP